MKPMTCSRKFNNDCSQWADVLSLIMGLISIMSWGIAEVPQIVTNYKEKSADGISIAFLVTWVVGDLFNLFGCMLEPATLPTQYYMAMLYTITTIIVVSQTIYYAHIHNKEKCENSIKQAAAGNDVVEAVHNGDDVGVCDRRGNNSNILSSPISLPSNPPKELYYVSARSLSSSHTPTAGSSLAQRMTAAAAIENHLIEEPLLDGAVAGQSTLAPNAKTMLFLVSAVTLVGGGMCNIHHSVNSKMNVALRRVLSENDIGVRSGVGTLLGWAMAAIYMGGRLPQICLNIRRGKVEGLNPLMFIFALIGNTTYVASILISSMQWSKLKPNLPWLVDAGGCVLLDTFILIQFFYFWTPKVMKAKKQNSDIA